MRSVMTVPVGRRPAAASRHTHARWCAGADRVAGPKGDMVADVADYLADVEDHGGGGAGLLTFAFADVVHHCVACDVVQRSASAT